MTEKHFLPALRRIVFGLLVAACSAQTAWTAGTEATETFDDVISLSSRASIYENQGRYADAEHLYQRALDIIGKRYGSESLVAAVGLSDLARLYSIQARYTDAEKLLQHSLRIQEKMLGTEHSGIAAVLHNLALLHVHQARYADAESLLRRSLNITKKVLGPEDPSVAQSQSALALLYFKMAQYDRAEALLEQAIEILEKRFGLEDHRVTEPLSHLAAIREKQARYPDAEQLHERILGIDMKTYGGVHPEIAIDLHNIGLLYIYQSRYRAAKTVLQQALNIDERFYGTENPIVAKTINLLAVLHYKQAQYADAELLHKRTLPIFINSGEHELLSGVQGNLSDLYASSIPNLSILYGKQAINTLQGMRETNISMDIASQRGFIKSVEVYYTTLADLLFAQNRLKEGLQVLAMLKEAEYHEFTGKSADAADDPRRSRVAYSPREAKWEQRFQDIAAKLAKAEPESSQYAAAQKEMDAFFEDVKKAFADDASGETNRLDNTSPMQKPLAQLGEGSVLVQYLMPQERLWLLITTKDGMKAQQVDIKADALTQKINAFKQAIVARSADVDTLGKELHGLLIAPAAEELQGAKTLMLAPDGALRYLPFAALHDGEKYLAQRYVLSNYTDMSKDRITDKPTANWSFAGFGVSKKVSDLHALPAVAGELDGIRANALDGTVRLDSDFTRESLQQALNSPPPVVHVASHFVFEKRGNEQASWLLLGDGGKLTLADIRKDYRFNNVDLVALSACNTGVGGEDKDGREVEGLGVLVQRQGAKGVLASLWEVADESTGQFMQLFYSLRQRQGLSKAEALQKAQLAFIEGRVAAELAEATRGAKRVDATGKVVNTDKVVDTLTHPYYWASFILMGNWL